MHRLLSWNDQFSEIKASVAFLVKSLKDKIDYFDFVILPAVGTVIEFYEVIEDVAGAIRPGKFLVRKLYEKNEFVCIEFVRLATLERYDVCVGKYKVSSFDWRGIEVIENRRVIDISSTHEGVSARLSNFEERHFIFDGVKCNSLEGFWQAVKFEDPEEQKKVCLMIGKVAKKYGQKADWKKDQMLYWQGNAYERGSFVEYPELIYSVYKTIMEQNRGFRRDLLMTNKDILVHSIGSDDPSKTVLTEAEFCLNLMEIRTKEQKALADLHKRLR